MHAEFLWINLMERANLTDKGVDGKTLLRNMSSELDERKWISLAWRRKRKSDTLL